LFFVLWFFVLGSHRSDAEAAERAQRFLFFVLWFFVLGSHRSDAETAENTRFSVLCPD